MHPARIIILLMLLNAVKPLAAETNAVLVFHSEKRAGAIIFTDECLTRGITNSMMIAELRAWATNTIQRYERVHNPQSGFVAEIDIPKSVRMIQTNIPSCRFSYADATNVYYTIEPDVAPARVALIHGSSGSIEAVSIDWYIYGVIVGPESFKPVWDHEPWYHRKLADGVYLWHGYK